MTYLTISTVMCIIGFQCPWIVIQFGWLVSYVWLRFYKKNTGDMISGGPVYGDRSETFAFVNWFPPFLQCVIPLQMIAYQDFKHINYVVALLDSWEIQSSS